MGLDDSIRDSKIIESVEEHIKKFVLLYSNTDELTDEKLDKWENSLCYTGYSVAFHTLYPLYETVLWNGSNPREMTESEQRLLKSMVRDKILRIMNNGDCEY